MDKRTIILLVSAIIVLLTGIGIAVFFLYSGLPKGSEESVNLSEDGRGGLLSAVPADAVAVFHFERMQTLVSVFAGKESAVRFPSSGAFRDFIVRAEEKAAAKELPSMKDSDVAVSYHYDGELVPLLILDAAKAGGTLPEDYFALKSLAESCGLFTLGLDCSRLAAEGTWLGKRSILLISASDVILKSAERHISQGISVLDQNGFSDAFLSVQGGKGQFLVSGGYVSKLVSGICNREYRKYSDFLRRVSSWTAFSFDGISKEHIDLSGIAVCGGGPEFFINALQSAPASSSAVAGILPSTTVAAYALPVADAASSIEAYRSFADTKIGQEKYDAALRALRKKTGVDPLKWAEQIDLKEVAVASFKLRDSFETVLLLRTGNPNPAVLFPDSKQTSSIKDYSPRSEVFVYSGFASALFGSLFSAGDESMFTFIDDWIIAGSAAAVDEYVSGRALDKRLSEYLEEAQLSARTDGKNLHFFAYVSLIQDSELIDRVFQKKYADALESAFAGADFVPAMMTVGARKDKNFISFTLDRKEKASTASPSEESSKPSSSKELSKDESMSLQSKASKDSQSKKVSRAVDIHRGPFNVKNCGTGKINYFYQKDNGCLCLKDENGKDLWNVEFLTPLCGRVSAIDFFANGKLQFLFASETKLYLIDRLGRFVKPFPIELGKDVLLGPDVYDFNSLRRYNVMILHKDNTIDMYNLQGRKPSNWKGITCAETITGLPEMLKVSGKTFWAVRTSDRTLIYSFYGGEPLTVSEGGGSIKPDSPLTPSGNGVEVIMSDGKKTTIELK